MRVSQRGNRPHREWRILSNPPGPAYGFVSLNGECMRGIDLKMNKKTYKKNLIISILLILAMLATPLLASLVSNAVSLGPASPKAFLQSEKTPGLVPNVEYVEVAPSYIFFHANIPLASKLNVTSMGLKSVDTYFKILIYIDLDANMSTGGLLSGRYWPNPLDVNNYTVYAFPGVDEIIAIIYEVANNSGIISVYDNETELVVLAPNPPYHPRVTLLNWTSHNIYDVTDNGIKIKLNWSQLEQAYYSFTGIKINTKYHRIYLLASPATAGGISSIRLTEKVMDELNCNLLASPVPIPNATVPMNESLKAWPNGSILCNDTEDNLGPLPNYYDAKSIYIARDNNYFYLGFLMNSTGEQLKSNNVVVQYFGTATLYYNATSERNFEIIYVSGHASPAQYIIRPNPYIYYYHRTGSLDVYNFSYPFFEAGIPLASILPDPQNFTNTAIRDVKPTVTVSVTTGFAPVGTNYITVYPFIIDEANGLVYSSPKPVNLTQKLVYGSIHTILKYPGMRIEGAFDTGLYNILVTGGISAGPMSLSSGKLPKGNGVPFYYYFSMSNASAAVWPLRIYIPLPHRYDATMASVYYFNKSVGGYVRVPSNYLEFYKSNNTVMIEYTRELYNAGDPGILVLAPYTVGGVLQNTPSSTLSSPYTILAEALVAFAVILALYRRLKPRGGI